MIKHHESQDNSIITIYLFMLDKRIGPQLLFFLPEIISFFFFVWNYRQQGFLKNLAPVDGTRNTILCGVQYVGLSLDEVWLKTVEGFSTSFTFLSDDSWVDRDILKLSHFTGVFAPLVTGVCAFMWKYHSGIAPEWNNHCVSLESRDMI